MKPKTILTRFKKIVANERLVHERYITDEVEDSHKDNICQGRRMCAVGSLWVAGGIDPIIEKNPYGGVDVTLPGSDVWEREHFLESHPELATVYQALNEAAESIIDERDIALSVNCGAFEGGLELLFEARDVQGEQRDADDEDYALLRECIARAEKKINAGI